MLKYQYPELHAHMSIVMLKYQYPKLEFNILSTSGALRIYIVYALFLFYSVDVKLNKKYKNEDLCVAVMLPVIAFV